MNGQFTVFWGIVVPGSIILFSLLVTLWLYRMFSREHHGDTQETRSQESEVRSQKSE